MIIFQKQATTTTRRRRNNINKQHPTTDKTEQHAEKRAKHREYAHHKRAESQGASPPL